MVWWPKFLRKPRIRLGHLRLRRLPTPSATALFFVTLIFVAFVFGGGIYLWVTASSASGDLIPMGTDPNTGNPLIIWPLQLDKQFVMEGLAAMFFVITGFGGLRIIHEAGKQSLRADFAQKLLVIGWALTIFTITAFGYMLLVKLGLA
ncbi:MAG: hypothetical protein ACXABG_06490 [Promethearchaeota archaeon]|jgi:hypothetical protein